MLVLAFFLCFCANFVNSLPVNQEEKPIICLDNLNGKSVRGFTNVKDMEWEILPCQENDVRYCEKMNMKAENHQRCKEICCPKVTTSTSRSGSRPSPATAVKTTGLKNETRMRPKRETPRKITDNPAVVISFLIGLFLGLVICGICVYRREKIIKILNKQLRQPIQQPMDSAHDHSAHDHSADDHSAHDFRESRV